MVSFCKNISANILLAMLLVVCGNASSAELSATRFGKVSSEFSEERLSIKLKDKVLLQADENLVYAETLAVKSIQDRDYIVIGMGMAGNCCPWLDVVILEVTAAGGVVYRTDKAIYLESKPKIRIQDNALEIVLMSLVDNTTGEDAKFIVKNGKLTGPMAVKKQVKAFSGKDCDSLFKIYSAECSGEFSGGAECHNAGLYKFQEVSFLAERNASNSSLFYDFCAESCSLEETKSLKEFSDNVCKVK